MRIGYDGKRAAFNRTGLGNYSRFVINSVAEAAGDVDLDVYVANPQKPNYLDELNPRPNIRIVPPQQKIGQAIPAAWRSWGITSQTDSDSIDIFHGLSNELPLNISQARCKSVVTVHDLIFLSHPQLYKPIDRAIYTAKMKRACRHADRIVAVSQFTAQQLIERLGAEERKISVIYQGCDPIFAHKPSEEVRLEVRQRLNLPERFMLYVGTIEERKNLMLAARAMLRLKQRGQIADIKLVAIGRPTPYKQQVEQFLADNGLTDQLMWLHGVSYTDLPVTYHLATAMIYPSVIEGFGIPLLEAVTAGIPAIGCTGSCLEEAGGAGSLYVAPDSPDEMADAMLSVWNHPALRQSMISSGLHHAERFSAERLGREMLTLYKSLL